MCSYVPSPYSVALIRFYKKNKNVQICANSYSLRINVSEEECAAAFDLTLDTGPTVKVPKYSLHTLCNLFA